MEIHRYVLPSVDGEGWGEILISQNGMFAAVSDYGNYAYRWRGFGGGDFREFVAGLADSPEYLAEKLHPSKIYDGRATVMNIKEAILYYRRRGNLSRNDAREEWRALLTYSEGIEIGETGFIFWLNVTMLLDAWELSCKSYPVNVMCFCKKLMPRLAEMIRKEASNV